MLCPDLPMFQRSLLPSKAQDATSAVCEAFPFVRHGVNLRSRRCCPAARPLLPVNDNPSMGRKSSQ